jgi:hypothetical protein
LAILILDYPGPQQNKVALTIPIYLSFSFAFSQSHNFVGFR